MNNNFVIMESYEKKYKEALEKLRSLHDDYDTVSTLIDIKEELKHIFPELKESEDERISKKIKKVLNWYRKSFSEKSLRNEEYDEMFAWLEKQKQEPIKVSIWKHWKNGSAGNRDGKLIYLVKNGNTYSLSSCLGFECDYIELSDLDNLMLEKQGNPTNEDMKEALRTEYEKGRADAFAQMQKPWSEEDEYYMEECINAIATKDGWSFEEKRKTKHWLNSIKQRYTWKPSELPHWKKSSLPNDKTTGFNSDNFCYNGYYINYKELFDKLPKDD